MVRAAESHCAWCALLPPFVRAARSVCWATVGSGGGIVHALKYDGWIPVAREMAARMSRVHLPLDVMEERTAIVPVPLSQLKLRERGFNQSELLAEKIAAAWNLPVWRDVLIRRRSTRTQTRLSAEEREANVRGAFCTTAEARGRLANAHLVLVDDVITTGATLNACAWSLYEAGARLTSYLTFGRAPMPGDL